MRFDFFFGWMTELLGKPASEKLLAMFSKSNDMDRVRLLMTCLGPEWEGVFHDLQSWENQQKTHANFPENEIYGELLSLAENGVLSIKSLTAFLEDNAIINEIQTNHFQSYHNLGMVFGFYHFWRKAHLDKNLQKPKDFENESDQYNPIRFRIFKAIEQDIFDATQHKSFCRFSIELKSLEFSGSFSLDPMLDSKGLNLHRYNKVCFTNGFFQYYNMLKDHFSISDDVQFEGFCKNIFPLRLT